AVAVGEAGCIPPAHALIANTFTREERPRAVAIYMLGGPLSTLIGYFGAGWLNELYGLRATFMLLGLPGLLVGALAWFTLDDPRSAKSLEAPASRPEAAAKPSLDEVCRVLWCNVTFRHLLSAFSIMFFFGGGIGQWQPAFFVRAYGMRT